MRVKDLREGEWYEYDASHGPERVKYTGLQSRFNDEPVFMTSSGGKAPFVRQEYLVGTWAEHLAKSKAKHERDAADRETIERVLGPHATIRQSDDDGMLVWIPRDLVGFL